MSKYFNSFSCPNPFQERKGDLEATVRTNSWIFKMPLLDFVYKPTMDHKGSMSYCLKNAVRFRVKANKAIRRDLYVREKHWPSWLSLLEMESSLFVNSLSTAEKTYHIEDNPKIYVCVHNPNILYNIHIAMASADGNNNTCSKMPLNPLESVFCQWRRRMHVWYVFYIIYFLLSTVSAFLWSAVFTEANILHVG